ncbi:MAG: mannose-1-phosphate guanylyltransferase/mannose-6-phosphate isomerase [Candidatus Gastranaerophilales bacterium]|nr:mannose-1-phosphate guanylyltransferase/mannose-6-phosphate isomerase [Candidatus Gastranaerophilales bacterium]
MYSIILAGGSGSRLWPLSRELYPKQLLNIQNKESLLQETFKRIADFVPASKIVSITNTKNLSNVKYQLSSITKTPYVISEPIGKNTAPAIAVSVKYIIDKFLKNKDDIILVVPSDHKIKDTKGFQESIKKGEKLAEKGYLVTFGVKPEYAETGFGYIQVEKVLEYGFKVKNFVEKPDSNSAQKYVDKDGMFWNSGMFMFKASVFMDELKKYAPAIYDAVNNFDFSQHEEIPYNDFERLPYISIDYALMEKSNNIAMAELTSDWIDVGSWKSIFDVSKKDMDNNVKIGHILDKDSKNSLMYSSSKLVATIGLEDAIVVETEDAILACKKDRVQDVKQVFETLKQQHDNTQMVHKTVYRPWGFYTVLAQGDGFLTKMIHVNPGQKLSVQSHNHRSEHWVVLSGTAKVVLEGKEHILSPGHSVDIAVKAIHSLQNPYKEDLKIIEVQKGDLLIEEDIIRYEDMYGRC